jgi:hypothetical protein
MNEINIKKLTKAQMKKISSNGSIIVKAGDHPVMVHPINFKRMTKSFSKGRGVSMKGNGLVGDFFNNVGHTMLEATKPYLSELASGAILSAGTALSAFQPELAPFIIPATLGLTTIANQYINDMGQTKTLPPIPEQQPVYQYQQPVYQPPPVAYSQMHSVPNLTGVGLYGHKGRHSYSGIMHGGNLLNGNQSHPALLSTNPDFLLNRNLRGSLYK